MPCPSWLLSPSLPSSCFGGGAPGAALDRPGQWLRPRASTGRCSPGRYPSLGHGVRPLSCGPRGCSSPSAAETSQWKSPAGAAEAPAPRAGDRLGSQPCWGVPRRLPKTGSPVFERKPNASSLHTSKGKPLCSSPGSSFLAGNSQGCLGPRCGTGWDGSPPRTPPRNPAELHQGCPVLLRNISSALLTSSWGRK